MNFDDFNLDLYEDPNEPNQNGLDAKSSVAGTNSSSSFVCATLTNFTETCNNCGPTTGQLTIICK